jgi:hypothetical protein
MKLFVEYLINSMLYLTEPVAYLEFQEAVNNAFKAVDQERIGR